MKAKERMQSVRSNYIYRPVKALAKALGFTIQRTSTISGPPTQATAAEEEALRHELALSSLPVFEPRLAKLELEDLLSFLEREEHSGFFETFNSRRLPLLCVLATQKRKTLESILKFCVVEGVGLRYRLGNKMVQATSIRSVLDDVMPLKSIKLYFSSLRSHDNFNCRLEFLDVNKDYYLMKGNSLISRKLWKQTATKANLFRPKTFTDYSRALLYPRSLQYNFDVDLVFTWVNSDDPDWFEMYKKYRPEAASDSNSESRFKSRDELKYALRSWDIYAPFIRKIFIVSNCAPPQWLDLKNERVRWVYHEEIIPPDSLPTFSSHAIETSLHKIDGISNYFIYSNDDFLLTRLISYEEFFHPNGIAKVRLEPYGMVNGEVTEGHPDYLNAARNSNTLIEGTFQRSTTQLVTHSPQPIRKDIMLEMEKTYPEEFNMTRQNKFRATNDIAVTGYLHAHYAILTSRAVYDKTPVMLIQQNHDFEAKFGVLQEAKNKSPDSLPISICINDGNDSHLNEAWNNAVAQFLETFFPERSTMELEK